ncbi:MAG TPA: hypothetical protein VNJ54_17450 [Plantibacter sp.]|uniref:hypothetical protein n=1 Tax=unclassified Plantibacter TaxID=2624265 RepID=UPI002CB5A7D0|nr:hypothetical protein [Plantibacter sp.]
MTSDDTTRDAEFSAMLANARTTVLTATRTRPVRRRVPVIAATTVLLIGCGTAAGVAVAGHSGAETYVGPTAIDVPAPDQAASALIVTFTCIDPGDYRVSVEGAPNGTMQGTCTAGEPGGERFGFQIAAIGEVTVAAQRIDISMPEGARFKLERWYQVPTATTATAKPELPGDATADPDSYPIPDPMTEEQLMNLAAASDAQLIAAMQERYADFTVPQVARERFVLEPEWAEVMAACLTEAGYPTTVEGEGLRNDRPTGAAEDQPWDTALTACSVQFPKDPRYSVPVNAQQLTFLYQYLVTVAMPYIQKLGGTVSPPPNLTDFIADYRVGENWTPFWNVSGEFDRTAMLELPQVPEGFYGADLAREERAYRDGR